MTYTVFVYGTLRRGEPRHHVLEGSEFLGEDRIRGYQMFDAGAFPAAAPGPGEIVVEVYEVDRPTLEALCVIEGTPHFYALVSAVSLSNRSGGLFEAVAPILTEGPRIDSGNWIAYRKEAIS
jgi:gamma-glutamylcyclotransferase (GGCT)/AIG2-like uncharacterized protein YtfP